MKSDGIYAGFGGLFVIGMLILGLAQTVVGFWGLEHALGFWPALILSGMSYATGIMLPLTIGAFIGAWKVLEWHWLLAVLFAAPGLVFTVPGLLFALIGELLSGNDDRHSTPSDGMS